MNMKRRFILTIMIFTFIFMNSFFSIFSIEEDLDYTYKITRARIYAKVGDNEYIQNGFESGGIAYPSGTTVSCIITNFEYGSINYNCTIGNNTRFLYSASNWVIISLMDYYMIYTTIKTYELILNWKNIVLFDLFFFGIRPYIHPIEYNWNYINALENNLYDTYVYTSKYPEVDCKYALIKSNDLVKIESWIGGKLNGMYGEQFDAGKNFPSDFSFGNSFHIVYLNSSGLVYGMGYRGWVQGTINSTSVKVSLEYQYQLINYSMPRYHFGTYKRFGDLRVVLAVTILFLIVVVVTVPTAIYLRKKRMLKKTKNES